ncbi:MAG: hypothetical protein IPK13_20420 [Deltaproteobacteria bacterium]|nr:hypothetical protein [Deltaproteobacteria bacterium]
MQIPLSRLGLMAAMLVVPSLIAVVAHSAPSASSSSPTVVVEGGSEAEEDPSPQNLEDAAREQIRSMLSGPDAGSLSNPLRLQDAHSVAKICRAIANVPRPSRDGDAYRRGAARAERASDQRRAMAQVYEVTLAGSAFRVGDYRFAKRLLPLELNRSMRAVDGSLILQVMDRRGGAFRLEPEEAKGIAQKLAHQQLALRVVFRAAQDEGPACFAYPKSGASNLRIEPLSYALIDQANGGVLARTRTPALESLRTWVHPGQARLAIDVRGMDAANRGYAALRTALQNARPGLERCVKDILVSQHRTLTASFALSIGRPKTPEAVRVLVQNAEPEQEDVVRCLEAEIAKTPVPPASAPLEVELWVAVERGDAP